MGKHLHFLCSLLGKEHNMSFLDNMLGYYFSLEVALQDVAKNNPTKKELDVEIQATLKHMAACQLKEEKMQS